MLFDPGQTGAEGVALGGDGGVLRGGFALGFFEKAYLAAQLGEERFKVGNVLAMPGEIGLGGGKFLTEAIGFAVPGVDLIAGGLLGGGGAFVGGGLGELAGRERILRFAQLAAEVIRAGEFGVEQALEIGRARLGIFQGGLARGEEIAEFEDLGLGEKERGLGAFQVGVARGEFLFLRRGTGVHRGETSLELDQFEVGGRRETHG